MKTDVTGNTSQSNDVIPCNLAPSSSKNAPKQHDVIVVNDANGTSEKGATKTTKEPVLTDEDICAIRTVKNICGLYCTTMFSAVLIHTIEENVDEGTLTNRGKILLYKFSSMLTLANSSVNIIYARAQSFRQMFSRRYFSATRQTQ